MRVQIGGAKYAKAKYDRTCLELPREVVEERIAKGESYMIRMKVPHGKTEFKDIVRGKVVFDNKDVDDQVIMKPDGFPTYHLANVVDDHLMKISHVIRGEVSNKLSPIDIMTGMAAVYTQACDALQNAPARSS
jgi:glutamyl/glutaminyl-tRNA synthetase